MMQLPTILSRLAICVSVLPALLLSACSNKTPQVMPYSMMEVSTSLTVSQQKALRDLICHSKVQIIQQGSRLQMILPVDAFFVTTTSTIKEDKIADLRRMALYVHNYVRGHVTHHPIKIYGYTDTVYGPVMRRYYSNQYAQVIAAFLWRHGFRPSQMRVAGYGAKHPIGNNRTIDGSANNRRVVIQVN